MTPEELQALVRYFKLLADIENKHKRHKTDGNLYNELTNLEGDIQ